MRSFIAIVAAFACLPLFRLIKIKGEKLDNSFALIAAALVMNLLSGNTLAATGMNFVNVFTKGSNLTTMLTVLEIGMLGALYKQYGILDDIVTDLEILVKRPKGVLMILPAVMGLLPVPGGAYLSSPFVDSVGERMGLSKGKRAAVNLNFRHCLMFLLPYSSSMLIISSIMGWKNIYRFALINLPLSIIMAAVGYFFLLRRTCGEVELPTGDRKKAAVGLLKNLSPIYGAVILNAVTGLHISACIPICTLFILIFCNDRSAFFKTAVSGLNFLTPLMMAGIYFVQNTITGMPDVMGAFSNIFSAGTGSAAALLAVGGASLAMGLATGNNNPAIGAILPVIAAQGFTAGSAYAWAFFANIWSFIGYYYSPLHMCQFLTLKQMDCPTSAAYRENIKVAPFLGIASVVLFFIYNAVL